MRAWQRCVRACVWAVGGVVRIVTAAVIVLDVDCRYTVENQSRYLQMFDKAKHQIIMTH